MALAFTFTFTLGLTLEALSEGGLDLVEGLSCIAGRPHQPTAVP